MDERSVSIELGKRAHEGHRGTFAEVCLGELSLLGRPPKEIGELQGGINLAHTAWC